MIIIKRYLIFVIILIFLTTIQVYGHFICSRIYNINSELRGSFFTFADFVFASQQLKVTLLKGFVASVLAIVEFVSLIANLWVYVVEVWVLEVGKEGASHAGAHTFVSRGLWKVMARLRLQACREAVFGAPR